MNKTRAFGVVAVGAVLLSSVMLSSGCAYDEGYRNRRFDQRFARTRAEIAADLARDAERNLELGYPHEALRLATIAVEFDRGWQPLVDASQAAIGDQLFQQASDALEQNQFGWARSLGEQALNAAPANQGPTRDLLAIIDQRESQALVNGAQSQISAGNTDRAREMLERASLLTPGDPAIKRQLNQLPPRSGAASTQNNNNDVTEVTAPPRSAELEAHHNAFLDAMESGDRIGALQAARAIAAITPSDKASSTVVQLEDELIRHTSAQAAQLVEEGRRDEALRTIDEAITVLDSSELRALRQSIGNGQ
ncbi:MAG: hypothetical protein ACR2GY_08825 [Phycisphaerales bacterium]